VAALGQPSAGWRIAPTTRRRNAISSQLPPPVVQIQQKAVLLVHRGEGRHAARIISREKPQTLESRSALLPLEKLQIPQARESRPALPLWDGDRAAWAEPV
jgi:hypothetical protein